MSDMIDHLRAISNAAGRDVALQLSDGTSIASMAGQVRAGVRRRRIRTGIAAASVATAVAVLALALPALLRNLPGETIEPGRAPIRTEGPLTVYDDGSMQVVLRNGTFFDVAPDPEGGTARVPWNKADACYLNMEDRPASGWVLDDPAYGRLVGRVLPMIVVGDQMTAVFEGSSYSGDLRGGMYDVPSIKVRIEADPAIAPYLLVQTRWAEEIGGQIEYFGHRSDANPWFELEGDASVGTERAILEANGPEMSVWESFCTEHPAERMGATATEYLFVDVWLVDRAGTATHIGTYTGSFEMTWKAES